jgi:serine/threonine-protein kinase RsbW
MAREFQMEIATMGLTLSLLPVPGPVQSLPFVEMRQSLPSRIEAISPFVDQLMRFILNFRNADGRETEIEVAVREALANAAIHGNGEDAHKRVYVECRCYMDGEASVTVQDEGQGFDFNTVPDPTTPENRILTHGRGIYLMKTLMDDISFEKGGAVVNMRKKSRAGSVVQRRAE